MPSSHEATQKDTDRTCLAHIKSCLQGKHLASRFDDKHTNGLFNGECRKTTAETKLHYSLTQSHETANIYEKTDINLGAVFEF